MQPQVRHAYQAVALGGVLGAVARLALVTVGPAAATDWPWALLLVNVSGSGALAFVLVWGEQSFGSHSRLHHLWRPFMATGVLGGYTTTSAYAVTVVQELDANRQLGAIAFLVGSVIAALIAHAVVHALSVRYLHRSRRT